MERIRLSKNFYLDEFTRSQTAARFGIDNSVSVGSPEYLALYDLVHNILQSVRDNLGPVSVTSGYRGSLLNLKIGGSANSQHTKGEAADFTVAGHTPFEVCEWIRDNLEGEFDQLIYEFGEWTHVSRNAPGTQRASILTAQRTDGETQYIRGIVA